MVSCEQLDDIDQVNFRFACRVYNTAWLLMPSPMYFWLETVAWESCLREEPNLNPASIFPIRFEELLFVNFGYYYDAIVQEIL